MQKRISIVAAGLVLAACATAVVQSTKDGLVEYAGSQKTIFESGKATQTLTVATMAATPDSFGVGAVAGLDGEITVYQGKPYVTKVRGKDYTMDHGHEHGAVIAVWTQQSKWREEAVPVGVKGYRELQGFVKARAVAAGIDVNKPFPFQLAGTPAEVKWHINVDLTEGKPIDSGLKNAIHIHLVSRDGKAAGHIDNITLAPGMVLRLPQR